MTLEMVFVLGLVVLAVVLFATEKLPVDLVALIIMGILLLSGLVSPDEGIAGFSNTATVTVGAMFILSAGLFRTGAVNAIGTILARIGQKNFWLALISIMASVGIMSAFINNTAAVAIFMPIVIGVAASIKVSASKLLMPLSFASMFGGVCTLIGTSTNILVSSIAERYGQPAFTMFEFLSLGLIFFAGGFVYMFFIGVRLIPDRRPDGSLTESFSMGEYLTDIILQPEAASVGKAVKDAPLVHEVDVTILNLYRNGKSLGLPGPELVLEAGDELRVRGNIEKIKKLQDREGIVLKPQLKFSDKDLESDETLLVEAVVAPNSLLVNSSLKEADFRRSFGAVALALRHRGALMREKLATTKLKAGDALLLEVFKPDLDRLKQNKAFVIVSEVGLPQFRKQRVIHATAIIAAVVITAALGIVPIVVGAIAGSVLLVLTGCITLEEAYRAVDWKVIFLLAGVLTLGVALEKSGAAVFVSDLLIDGVGAWGPAAILSALYLLTALLTSTMSNNATAALLAPIAISAASTLDVDPRGLLMAVTFAASSSFMTPVGYQTNTMIYGVGQYRFKDFLKVGTPLTLLFWILATIFIPQFWPF
jgi:di/tricarboxylate transporter